MRVCECMHTNTSDVHILYRSAHSPVNAHSYLTFVPYLSPCSVIQAVAYHSSVRKTLADVTELFIGDQSVHFLLHDLPQSVPRKNLQMQLLHSETFHLPCHLLCHTGIQRLHLGGGGGGGLLIHNLC